MIPLNRKWLSRFCLLLFTFLLCAASFAQDKRFFIRGGVFDKNFRTPLVGGMAFLHDVNGNVIDSCTIDQERLWSNEQKEFIKQPIWEFCVEYYPLAELI